MPGCSGWRVGFLCYVNFYSHAAANHPIDVSRGTSTPSEPNTQTKNWKETNPIANRGQTWNPILGSTRSPCSSSRFQFPSIPVSLPEEARWQLIWLIRRNKHECTQMECLVIGFPRTPHWNEQTAAPPWHLLRDFWSPATIVKTSPCRRVCAATKNVEVPNWRTGPWEGLSSGATI